MLEVAGGLAGQKNEISSREMILRFALGLLATVLVVICALAVVAVTSFSGGILVSSMLFGKQPNQPLCHKLLLTPLYGYLQTHLGGVLPNVDGKSNASFVLLASHLGSSSDKFAQEWLQQYKYVPGLNENDPGDLVLLYMVKPTRWVHHIAPAKAWDAEGWIVCPIDLMTTTNMSVQRTTRLGELSESLTEEQFRERLQKTLDFLKANQRPHWEVVIKEHQEVLDALPSVK